MKNKPTLKKGIVAASVVAGVAGGLVAGLALGVPGFAGASSNGVQGAAAAFAKNAVVQVADSNIDANTDTATNAETELPGTISVMGSTDVAAGEDHAPRGPRAAIASDAVAKVLGLTADELRTELQSGKSLADIAKAKGVDIAKVKQAIIADFTAREQAEVAAGEHTQAEVDQKIADLTSKIDDIVNGVKPSGMPGDMRGHGPRGGGIASDAVAKVLGLTADELRTELQSGKSLADVAKAKGVDVDKVKAAITADVKAHLDEEVASGEHTQAEADEKLANLTARLDDMVNGVRPAGAPGEMGDHGKGHGPRGGVPFASDAVAKALGLTADELRTELQSGKSLADVAKAKGVDVAAVKAAITADVKAHLDEEVASGEHTQAEADAKLAELTARLDDIVNGVRPAGMPGEMGGKGGHGMGGHGPRGGHGEMGGMNGQSGPTLQGDVQVQPSSANA